MIFFLGHIRHLFKKVIEIEVRHESVGISSFNDGIYDRTCLRPLDGSRKQPVFAADGERTNTSFGTIIAELQPSVQKKIQKPLLWIYGITNRASERRFRQCSGNLIRTPKSRHLEKQVSNSK